MLLVGLLGVSLAADLPNASSAQLRLVPMADDRGSIPILAAGGSSLVLPGGNNAVAARMEFVLPPHQSENPGWVIWMGRVPVNDLQLRNGAWRSSTRSFYVPGADEGLMPIGYAFPLPGAWEGRQSVELHARADGSGALRPELLTSAEALQREHAGLVTSAMIYASLMTLALLSLALLSAARDGLFLAFFGYALAALAVVAALNGHVYTLPWLSQLAAWRAFGPMALLFAFGAGALQMLMQYAGTRAHRSDLARVLDVFCAIQILLAAACLLNLTPLMPSLRAALALAWVASGLASIAVVVDAARRGVPMAWAQAVLLVLTVVTGTFADRTFRGNAADLPWSRYGYQVALAVSVAVLAVGLISRISEYRDQRDRDRLARADSERRMRRQAARSNLNAVLQTQLRACAENDLEWTAFRLLLDHLMPQVRAEAASMIAHGYHGQNVLVALPAERRKAIETSLAQRQLSLKRQAANGIPLQQPVSPDSEATRIAMEALIPLQIRSPAWGMLVLERSGGEGFSTEELALAGECARLTLTHVDQALAAISLRRSAELDALTGIFNRRTIDQWLVRCFADAQRDAQPISVLFVDMDHFKAINDKYGHAAGDHCLRKVAETLRASLADGDLVGRYGGEEFIAVLPGRGGAAARRVAEQLRLAIEQLPIAFEEQSLQVTVSVGVATRSDEEMLPADTIDRADKALYGAKRGGRNCVHVAPAIFS